jgi:hypothetical protein
MPGYLECVQKAWVRAIPPTLNPRHSFHTKLSRTTKALHVWSKSLVPQGKLALQICREVILQLEKAQETRQLSSTERD